MILNFNFISNFFFPDIVKTLLTCYFGNFGNAWQSPLKSTLQKINFITHCFLKILQRNSKLVILGNLGMPGHTLKMIVSIWGNHWRLSAGKKLPSSFKSFVFISRQKNNFIPRFSKDWLSAFREPEFWQIWDWWWNINNNISFHLRLFPRKT